MIPTFAGVAIVAHPRRWAKHVRPLLVGHRTSRSSIAVWCPYCKMYHNHGWDFENEPHLDAQHRMAHCAEGSPFKPGGYFIAYEPPQKDWTPG
jgi:hypothetical protein